MPSSGLDGIDVEIGHCVIEVKKDLRVTGVLEAARP